MEFLQFYRLYWEVESMRGLIIILVTLIPMSIKDFSIQAKLGIMSPNNHRLRSIFVSVQSGAPG